MKLTIIAILLSILSIGAGLPDPDDEHVIDVLFPGEVSAGMAAPSWANFIVYWERRMFYAKAARLNGGALSVTRFTYSPVEGGKNRTLRFSFLIPHDEVVGVIPINKQHVFLGDIYGG